jgi:hypothetical protein
MIRKLYNILGSLNLGLWLMAGVTLLMGIGSFVTGPEESARLNSMPLFAWLTEAPPATGWWLWLTIALLAVLALNTVLCSIESLRQKAGRPGLLLRLAPQAMHAGFLLIVLAHLISSVGGFKEIMQVGEGSVISFPKGRVLFERIDAETGMRGYVTDFSATVVATDGRRAVIRPNEPFFFEGVGIYLKQVEPFPRPVGLVEIHREPGAAVALAGALLFTVGNVVVVARRRQEK